MEFKKEITRGDSALFYRKQHGSMRNAPASGFTDVPARGVVAVNSLEAAGIINGKTATKLVSATQINGDAAVMLSKAYALQLESGECKSHFMT